MAVEQAHATAEFTGVHTAELKQAPLESSAETCGGFVGLKVQGPDKRLTNPSRALFINAL